MRKTCSFGPNPRDYQPPVRNESLEKGLSRLFGSNCSTAFFSVPTTSSIQRKPGLNSWERPFYLVLDSRRKPALYIPIKTQKIHLNWETLVCFECWGLSLWPCIAWSLSLSQAGLDCLWAVAWIRASKLKASIHYLLKKTAGGMGKDQLTMTSHYRFH